MPRKKNLFLYISIHPIVALFLCGTLTSISNIILDHNSSCFFGAKSNTDGKLIPILLKIEKKTTIGRNCHHHLDSLRQYN